MADPKVIEALTIFNGPVTMRNPQFGGDGGCHRDTGALEEREIAQVIGHHVAPPCQQVAEQELGRDHLLIIEGPAGHGKRAGAITVLRKRTNEPLTALSPVTELRELANREYRSGHGYLVVNHMDGASGPGTGQGWRRVRDAVRDAGAFMVITRAPTAAASTVVTVLPWERPPLADVLRAHLGDAQDSLAALIEALPPDCAMSDVAAVAGRVAAGATVVEALGALRTGTGDAVRSWFDHGRTDRELLGITALAFSTGVTEDEFGARTATLDGASADIVGAAGPLIDKDAGTVEFREPAFRERVLAEVRARCPKSFWDTVSSWLDGIVRDGADLAVADGLADLAATDLAWVEKTCLDPWSDGALGWAGQVTAAFTLWSMSRREQTAPVALRVVRDWVKKGSPAQRHTAALALAGELGARYPVDAVDWVWSLLAKSAGSEQDNYMAAYATLFSTLTRTGDDGGIVLGHLGQVLGHARGAAERDAGARTAQVVLSIDNDDAGEPVVSTYLRDRPDQAPLFDQVLSRLDRDAAQEALMHAMASLNRDEVGKIADEVSANRAEPVRETRTSTDQDGDDSDDGDDPTEEDRDHEDETGPDRTPYPIVRQEWVRAVRGRRARARSVPSTETHEVLVWRVRGEHVLDRGGRAPGKVLRQADQVSVVDVSLDRDVVLTFPVRSKDDVPFTVLVTFTCSVLDPVEVVADGLRNAEHRLLGHVTSHRPLFDLGVKRALLEIDIVRTDISATIKALVKVRPIEMPGMTADLTGIDVVAPTTRREQGPTTPAATATPTTHRPKEEDV